MSVFDGEIDFRTITMVDFCPKGPVTTPNLKRPEDNCLIVGVGRDALKARDAPRKSPDVLCPIDYEYYKEMTKRIENEYPELAARYLTKDIDPIPIDHGIQDLKRSEYGYVYCSRELPFMSANMARRARALQTLHLPDDIEIPDSVSRCSYRPPPREKIQPPSLSSMKPKYDPGLTNELRRILRVTTGDSSYGVCHGLLAKVVLEKNPFGKPRKEPKFGKWRSPYYYSHYI